ncbi:MAG: HEAT repeat domain-containing protein [Myxacorys californica WJT36-NPBG1]|jgi:HEAT repeat protein|nr:HEAT repeat domain-containing protein [Myxacorys californica WJT36-NPBG1]
MSISLIILSLVAILAAIEAALKTRERFVSHDNHPSSTTTPVPPETRKESSEFNAENVESGSSSDDEPVSNVSNATLDSANFEHDIPLATSLTISEVVDPVNPEKITIPDLYPGYPLESEQQAQPHHTPDVLQEINQLDHQSKKDQIAHLAQYVQHPDSVLRVVIASTLGGLLPDTQGDDRQAAIALLTRLSQDADSQVRVQAAASLGELHSTEITP